MEASDPIEMIRGSPLFKGVRPGTFELIRQELVPETWPKQTVILSAAQTNQRFFIVRRGRVKIVRTNGHSGRELTLWLLGPGDGFDLIALLDGQPHEISAWAIDEVQGYSAPIALLQKWMDRDSSFRLAVHRYAAHQLRQLSDLAADLALHDTATRLARLLLHYCGAGKRHSAAHTRIDDLPHEELAAMIGSVRVVVNRLISRFKRDAIVQTDHGRLLIRDMSKLMQQAQATLPRSQTPGTLQPVRG
jgi:CRP-like cAMP-binding protein